jgi:hypothetical protein
MRKVKSKLTPARNIVIPGKPMSVEDFKDLILEAESGEFYTVAESKKRFQEWRKKNYKL